MRENHSAYHRIWFRPRVLVNVEKIDISTTMLGTKVAIPFYITATALGKLGHPEGEVILTRAARKHGVIQMIPTLASCSFDELVDAREGDQVQWLQLYVSISSLGRPGFLVPMRLTKGMGKLSSGCRHSAHYHLRHERGRKWLNYDDKYNEDGDDVRHEDDESDWRDSTNYC